MNNNESTITHWDYRIVKQTIDGQVQYGIHEVYFEGEEPVTMAVKTMNMVEYKHDISGCPSPIDELKTAIDLAKKACDKPIIDWDEVCLEADNYFKEANT